MNINKFENTLEYAQWLDTNDPLKKFRNYFHIPVTDQKQVTYLCGNSLGLQPITVGSTVNQELQDWADHGVAGHMKAKSPWIDYHKTFASSLAALTGAFPHEVIAMNSLTVNLHLMLSSFYKPGKTRYKILTEAGSFSSDIYALKSHVKMHGLDPKDCIIEVAPRTEEFLIHEEDFLNAIAQHGSELSLVLLGAVNYYTGQAFNIAKVTDAAHKVGAFAGFDLAHAIGNIPLELHNSEADFAVWCTYKYLNSGPGGVGGMFINEKFGKNKSFPRLAGWWGQQEEDRFMMTRNFNPSSGAEGFQLSNVPILLMAAHRASLNIFDEAGFKNILKKGRLLSAYLHYLIKIKCTTQYNENRLDLFQIKIITPEEQEQRGNQLSLMVFNDGKKLFEMLTQQGFVVDWRSPSVIRISPAPLYNQFVEVFRLCIALSETCIYI